MVLAGVALATTETTDATAPAAAAIADSGNTWPDNPTVTLELRDNSGNVLTTFTATVSPATGTGKVASFDFTHAQTAALTHSMYPAALVIATASGDTWSVMNYQVHAVNRGQS